MTNLEIQDVINQAVADLSNLSHLVWDLGQASREQHYSFRCIEMMVDDIASRLKTIDLMGGRQELAVA